MHVARRQVRVGAAGAARTQQHVALRVEAHLVFPDRQFERPVAASRDHDRRRRGHTDRRKGERRLHLALIAGEHAECGAARRRRPATR